MEEGWICLRMPFLRCRFSCEARLGVNLSSIFNAILAAFGNGLGHPIILNFLDIRFLNCDSDPKVGLLLNFSVLAIQPPLLLYFRSLGYEKSSWAYSSCLLIYLIIIVLSI